MSNIPTAPEIRPVRPDDFGTGKPSETDDVAQRDIEQEDIEEEEQADVDRLEQIDAALTENGGP